MKLNIIYTKSSEQMHEIPNESVDLVVTSPPYNIDISYGNVWKNRKIVASKVRKYKDDLPEAQYKEMLRKALSESYRVLKKNGSLYLNMKSRYIDDSLVPPFWITELLPNMYLKNVIVWNFDWGGSTNIRFAPRHEFVLFFTKDKKEWIFNLDDIKIPSLNYRPDRYKTQLKNPTDVWRIPLVSGNFNERTGHPAQYPEKLIERIIKVSTNKNGIVLDPFMGSGTTAVVAKKLGRYYVGYDTEKEYVNIAKNRIRNVKLKYT